MIDLEEEEIHPVSLGDRIRAALESDKTTWAMVLAVVFSVAFYIARHHQAVTGPLADLTSAVIGRSTIDSPVAAPEDGSRRD